MPLKSASWLYHELGLASVHQTGHDAHLIILARTCRMFSFGAISLIIALFLSSLDFSDVQIGLFMTLTLAGDVLLSLLLALCADSLGRRRVFFVGGALMAVSGAVFTRSETYSVLLLAAVAGVMSATGGDFGPFRSIEESTLAQLTTSRTRADVLSWYVTTSALGSAVGTEVSGKLVGWISGSGSSSGSKTQAHHKMFWVYVAMGGLSMVFSFLLSPRCELKSREGGLTASREDVEGPLLTEVTAARDGSSRRTRWLVSPESRPLLIKLWTLLTIDALADGMTSDALTTLYLTRKFGLGESYLGDTMATSRLLMAASTVFAGPLARRLGLVNTMVFTHLPSSAAVLLFPAPQSLPLTVALLFVNTALNSLDQGPRSALIAAVVRPEERTAVMGITSTLRTLGSMMGPSVTGVLASHDRFWVAYVVAGGLRIGYDLGLYWMFTNVALDRFEGNDVEENGSAGQSDTDASG